MTGSKSFQHVQLDYERLRATYPDLSRKELWRRANQAAVDYPDDFDEDAWLREVELAHHAESPVVDMKFVSSGGLSLRAVGGVVLVCIAMGLATAVIVWFDHIPIGFRPASAVLVWLSVFVLGPGVARPTTGAAPVTSDVSGATALGAVTGTVSALVSVRRQPHSRCP